MAGPLKGYLWSAASSYEYILGNYEDPKTIDTFLSWLKPGSVFYDLGANAGYFTLIANRVITEGKIYSFEPSPAARHLFEKHLEINSDKITAGNISLLPFAISNAEKQIEFSDSNIQKEGNTYIKGSPIFSGAENKITVQCYSVDGLLDQGFERPDVMKIDVEGAEYDVLQGAVKTLQLYKPGILLATHDCHLPGVQEECVQLLKQLGYTVKHTGNYNKQMDGLDDYIAIHQARL